MSGQSQDGIDRLQYLTKGELRAEIVYAVGGDPTRYGAGSDRGLKKADIQRIATHLEPEDSDADLDAMDLGNLYEVACRWGGGEYHPNAGKPWGVNRSNLKQIHQAVGGEDPTALTDGQVAESGGDDREVLRG
jgi:hypothetical protein